MQCQICQTDNLSLKKLFQHIKDEHQLTSGQYWAQFLFEGVYPTCKCGCGELSLFRENTQTFADYKRGHVRRGQSSWNAGLSKETDERVAAYGKSQSKNFTEERRQVRSERMTKNRLSGVVPTLYGPDSSQWKGGTSSLNAAVNADNRLYWQWKFPKLKVANFRCTRCGSEKDLCVHHDQERMAMIIHRFKHELQYDDASGDHELKRRVIDAIVDHHLEHGVSGVVLCYACHEQEHESLNFKERR